MRRTLLVVSSLLLAATVSAKNMYIPISANAPGANNTLFRTDVRIYNPNDRQIAVTLHFLPRGADGSNISGRRFDIPARQMMVLNNVIEAIGGFPPPITGAIRFDSDDTGTSGPDFHATSRTYTDSPNPAAPGTFGQFIPALEANQAKRRVVVLQLANSSNLAAGFRSNVGAMNPNREAAMVTPTLFAANGTTIKTGAAFTVPAMSVIQQSLSDMFATNPLDFADGFVVFDSSVPIFGYGSVVDNRSSDQIFVLGAEATGETNTPAPTEKSIDVGPGLVFSPANVTIKAGDTVKWEFRGGVPHSTTSDLTAGPEVWDSGVRTDGAFSRTFHTPGSYKYHCTVHSFPGANGMNGTITVTP